MPVKRKRPHSLVIQSHRVGSLKSAMWKEISQEHEERVFFSFFFRGREFQIIGHRETKRKYGAKTQEEVCRSHLLILLLIISFSKSLFK